MFTFALPKGLFRYMFLPEIGARIHSLFMGGFGYVPYFIAVVYQMVGLLPQNHPYLFPRNIGRFGIRHVVAEASRNLTFSWRNIDQLILFVSVLAGLVIFLMQFVALIAMVFFQPATAGVMPTNWTEFFFINNVGYRRQDLAFIMLDMVFGVPHPSTNGAMGSLGFFESCVSTADACDNNFGAPVYEWQPVGGGASGSDMNVSGGGIDPSIFGPLSSNSYNQFPFAYHIGLHRIFAIYSSGLLVIAVIITSYFIATILAETAQSGIPFGRRFNKTWAPLRIVVAFGLLMPLTSGLNSSQYAVLYAAKFGSAFASNGWRYFNDTLNMGYYGEQSNLVSVPNPPKTGVWTQFMFVALACKYTYESYALKEARNENPPRNSLNVDEEVHAYVLGDSASGTDVFNIVGTPYASVLTNLNNDSIDTIVIRFGIWNDKKFGHERNGVAPVCGELHIPMFDPRDAGAAAPGPYHMQRSFYDITARMWGNGLGGGYAVGTPTETSTANRRYRQLVNRLVQGLPGPGTDPDQFAQPMLTSDYVNSYNGAVNAEVRTAVQDAVAAQRTSTKWGDPTNNTSALYQKGWAGAGIWYNKISEMNGSMTAAVASVPVVSLYPEIMEKVWALKAKYDSEVEAGKQFQPDLTKVDSVKSLLDSVYGYELAVVLWEAFDGWAVAIDKDALKPADNPILSAISSILGLDGLYNLRENQTTHPLAMLSGVGRSLVESSIRSLGYAAVISGVTAIAGKAAPKALAKVSASFFVTIAMLGLTVGFVLFYVVPFLPFIYFFFAVGGWIKGVFEALVGAPLWALAHIRIDGHGLPGQAALNGYYLIFEVFLRPILVLFGLLASISIYSALVSVLNTIFDIAVANMGGFDLESSLTDSTVLSLDKMRGLIDQFFYTVIYAIIVYLLGMSSFKLIDTIPNNILRWMGQSLATFGDQRENPAETLVSKASIGSQQATGKIGGGLNALVGAATK